MKLIITQPEIEAIVRAHVENTVQLREGADMKIDFTATRSDDGITATIDIPYLGVAGIPAIAAANEAKDASAPNPNAPKPRAARAAAPKPAPAQNAGSLLGAGTTAATDSPANPEPVEDDVATTEAVADDAQTNDAADAAPFETNTEVTAAAEEVAAAAPAAQQGTTRGPSLFGNSAFKL